MTSKFKLVVVVRGDLHLSRGRIAAQTGHVCINAYREGQIGVNPGLTGAWLDEGGYLIILEAKSLKEFHRVGLAAQKEHLQVNQFTDDYVSKNEAFSTTCLSIGPCYSVDVDIVTRKLKLL